MKVLIWITEGTWPACVAAADWIPPDAEVELLYVVDSEITAAAAGAYTGLLGRGRPDDPGQQVAELSAGAADQLLAASTANLDTGRRVTVVKRSGRIEREVVEEAAGADLLVCARDGDRTRLGPHSLGPATRFVVDHAPCQVLLVWPEPAPGLESIPPLHRLAEPPRPGRWR
jgi:nucleotide-binding universal stress UspA family protein